MQAQRVVDEIRSGISLLDSDEVEGIANGTWGRSAKNDNGTTPTAEALVAAHGGVVVYDPLLPNGFDGLVIPHSATAATFVIRPHKHSPVESLRIVHELGHWRLRFVAHTHADVWRVAIAILWPSDRLMRGCGPVLAPSWALKMRLAMVAECGLIPAA